MQKQNTMPSIQAPAKRQIRWPSLVIITAVSLFVSIAISLPVGIRISSEKIERAAADIVDGIDQVNTSYQHSFLLFEQLLQQELRLSSDADEIETYLKSMDKRLLNIEGDDFDGVYMYYRGRYLYSWDTPYSVYEESGYDATTRPWYIGAVEAKGKVVMTNPYASDANDYMLATIKLCLVDWKMPDMDGVEITQKIREIFGNDTIVITISAYDLSEAESSVKAAGANYFIAKPLFQSTLFNALMSVSGNNFSRFKAEKDNKNYDFHGKKVLVAEDVALNLEVATKLLQMVGVEVISAEDGKQALQTYMEFAPGTFDCILMDINMPVMDGYEATKLIRDSGRSDSKTIPIYAMTANAFSEDVSSALNSGMNGHIAKPIELKVLYSTLETAFGMADKKQEARFE